MQQRNYDIPELRRLDVAHHLPAQTSYGHQAAMGGSRIVTHAKGATIYDGDGKAILDGMAGLWCVAVGYGRDELADAAQAQMRQLPYYNTFFQTATPPPIELATRLAGLLGGELQHVFFNNSGSESNDTVLRLVRSYWRLKGHPERSVVIARTNAYHGSTIAGVSLGGMGGMREQTGELVGGIAHIMQPYWFGEGFDEDPEAFGLRAADALEQRILEIGPDRVGAFIAEPVQGAGGVIIPPETYWPRIEAICRKYGVLIVSDEVICGFGRLGSWFGFQHFGFTPDIVSMAKGLSSGYLPISATAASREIVATLRASGEEFIHGFTYSGHPVSAAVALRNLDILEDEGLVARVANEVGPYLAKALERIARHPLVGETRSLGLIGAVEFVARKGTNTRWSPDCGVGLMVRDACIERGLMVRAIRDSIVMSPPLVITCDEIDRLETIILAALDETQARLLESRDASAA